MDEAIVIRPVLPPGGRVIAVSDIHGHCVFFQRLWEQLQITPQDTLVLVGDILEKGPDSLALARLLVKLAENHTIYSLCGNWDGLVLRFFQGDALDDTFFSRYLPRHPESILRQMARELQLRHWWELPQLRQRLREEFSEIWAWLAQMPTILETEHLVFVHGGVPSLDGMERLNRWACMKNDNFMEQGHRFGKYVVVGHWPVTLYHPDIPSAAPLWDRESQIISIDGGCVLKLDGQLNALIFPSEDSNQPLWTAYDGLPLYRAIDSQPPSWDSINIRWGHSRLELLSPGEEFSLCRHLESGRVLPILSQYLHRDEEGLWCEDSTDYQLPVKQGDILSLVVQTGEGALVKGAGVTGWYQGRLEPYESSGLPLLPLKSSKE